MNIEENRLLTFSYQSWPDNAPVSPGQLARGGFHATCRFLEAQCYWCQCRINDWQYGDQVEERHRQVDPQCAFIANYATCGNIPMSLSEPIPTTSSISPSATAASVQKQSVDLFVEANRLATFENWPNPNISPQSLAKAGFYYLNRSDQVRCAWCKGVIAKWEKEDNAFQEHQRFFPDCPRVQLGPLIEIASEGIRDLGIQQISAPKKPKFSSIDARLRTYDNWPIGSIQQPEALAQAGLYYQNVDDQVRCFHCNIGLRSWQKEDDPWFEHAKWYPQCQFVRLVKGIKYVQDVQEMTKETVRHPICPSMTIGEAMATAPVMQALEIGIDAGSIRNATQRQLLTVGYPYDTVEDLLKAVFDNNHSREDEDTANSHENEGSEPSIIQEVSRIIDGIFGVTDAESVATSAAGLLSPPASTACSVDLVKRDDTQHETRKETCEQSKIEPQPQVSRAPSPTRNLALEEENRQLKDARLCKVCLDEEVGVVFLPCGHLVTCVQCAPGVSQCPLCRTTIKGFVRTYLS